MCEHKARIFLINHQHLVRLWLGQLIEKQPGLTICGTAENVPDALPGIAETSPEVTIVDIALLDHPEMELITAIKSQQPSVVVIVLSMREKDVDAESALLETARGFVMKLNAENPIIEAIYKSLRIRTALERSDQAELFHEAAHWKRTLS